MSGSEVARLQRQIELELEAVQRGMYGLAAGTARHDFIQKRMDRVGMYHGKLVQKVGEEVANQMVYTMYNEAIK